MRNIMYKKGYTMYYKKRYLAYILAKGLIKNPKWFLRDPYGDYTLSGLITNIINIAGDFDIPGIQWFYNKICGYEWGCNWFTRFFDPMQDHDGYSFACWFYDEDGNDNYTFTIPK